MYVIDKMKLNMFQLRLIVSNRALFLANGEKPALIDSKQTADCYNEPSIEGASKLKVLGLADEISKTAWEKHVSAGESEDMVKKNAKDY